MSKLANLPGINRQKYGISVLFSEYIRKLDREKRETLMSEQYWSGTPDKSPDQDAYEAAEAGTEEVSGTYRDAVHGVLALPKTFVRWDIRVNHTWCILKIMYIPIFICF